MKTTWIATLATVAMTGTLTLYAQDVSAPDGGPNQDGAPGQLREQFVQQVREIRQQIDTALAGASDAYAELLGKEDKTFEDMQALAHLRHELIAGSAAAQELQGRLDALREHFAENHPDAAHGHRPDRPDSSQRPTLTDAQRAALQAHKEALAAKHDELNALLADASGRYAELLAADHRTPAEIREMIQLRRQLIHESATAQEKLEEIQALVEDFRAANPDLARPLPRPIRRLKRNVEAIQTLNDTVNDMLAADSDEFAALLAKEDKTPEDMAQLHDLRRDLLTENDEAAQLARTAQMLRMRLHHRIRDARDRQDHRIRPLSSSGPRPGHAGGHGGVGDGGDGGAGDNGDAADGQ